MTVRQGPVMAAAVLAATAAFCAAPFLTGGFDGYGADAFPVPQTDAPVRPARWAFAIWGVIYLWLAVSAVFGLAARANETDWAPMRPRLVVSLAVGAFWLPVAALSPVLATALIFVMLVTAILAFHDSPYLDFWLARAPLALYSGWLTAASFVSLGLVLGGYGLTGERAAALIVLGLALGVAGFVIWTVRGTGFYAAAMAWALAAIAVNAVSLDILVCVVAAIGAALMAARAVQERAGI